jgi:hypothetical protein
VCVCVCVCVCAFLCEWQQPSDSGVHPACVLSLTPPAGIHCTHGYNRTGFMIVSYMVERLDFAVDAALANFFEAREPGIYKCVCVCVCVCV